MIRLTSAWRETAVACGLVTLAVLGLFWPTFSTMVDTWADIETYSHGFLIAPISLWLVWRERARLEAIVPVPAIPVLLFTVIAAGLWIMSRLLGVQVGEQLALIGLWTSALWALIGHRAARVLAFPLAFLFLMVPMGDSLVPPMMDFTADFTVWLLELTGVPVYREGLFFVIPSGNWSVVEACSGVRYLIASFTLGLLYAYLTYRSLWRRLLFIALAIIVPIIANGLRAYMIVMIGHLSDMRLAVGVDHLIYGWVFFGLVMFLLFWLGNFWVEQDTAATEPDQSGAVSSGGGSSVAAAAVFLATVVIFVGARTTTGALSAVSATQAQVVLPVEAGGWRLDGEPTLRWPLALGGADQALHVDYVKQGQRVSLVLGIYFVQRQGHEVISSENRLLDRRADEHWRIVGHHRIPLSVDGRAFEVPVARIARTQMSLLGEASEQLRGAFWYRLGDLSAVNEYVGKWYQALALLTDGRRDGAFIMIVTREGGDGATPDATLQSFAAQALPDIVAALDAPYGD